jgi:peptide/nickel transport system substrate-binding protein
MAVWLVGCSAPAPAPVTPAAADVPTTTPTDAAEPSIEATAAPAEATATSGTPRVAITRPAAAAPTATPGGSGSLIEASLGNLSMTLHPYPDSGSYSQAWVDAAALIWGGADGGGALLAFDWDALDYRPAMAAQMPRVSSDQKTFTFTLRGDLTWSDGSPLSTEDFQFAFEQADRDENRYVQLDLLQDIATYRTPDMQTIEVTLKDARPRDVALAIVNVITPVPTKVWSGKAWNDASSNPEILNPSVVLGPFRAQDFVMSQHATFVPLDHYYLGTPRVPLVEILANQQPTLAFESLKSGRANWVHALPPAQYQEARANADLSVKEWTAANAPYRSLEFNLSRPFLGDKRVRQALAYAVSRADLLNVADQGLGVPQYGFVQPTNQRWVNTTLDRYEFDMARAAQLLKEAGYRLQNGELLGKDGQQIRLQVVYPTSSEPRSKIATYLQQQYRVLGIAVDVKGLDFNAYTDQVQSRRDFDISLATYGGGSIDPELGVRAQLFTNGQQNVTGYSNSRVDDLFRQAAVELDAGRRKQLYDQIQAQVNADLPSHYLYALKSVDAFSNKVHGVTTHTGDRLDYNGGLLSWTVDP